MKDALVCLDCPARVRKAARTRCHACHLRAERAAQKRVCSGCTQLRHLHSDGRCAGCRRAAAPRKTPKTTACRHCHEQRRNVGHGLCNRCALADPDRPFRYAAALAARMQPPPHWWDLLVEFTADRYHPSGTVTLLRETGRLVITDPAVTPHQLLTRTPPLTATTERVLIAFFTHTGLALPPDRQQRRAAARREAFLTAVPDPLNGAVAAFNDMQMTGQDRRRRTGQRTLSDVTLETRLRILRDLATDLITRRNVTGWAQVTTADLELFLAGAPAARHQRTYVLRRFFGWAKARRFVFADPSRPLSLGTQPGFTGRILDVTEQRSLFARWTNTDVPAQERLVGLLALLHAASNAEIRGLTVADVDPARRTVALSGRPFPTPLDPASWTAVEACLAHRESTRTLNPHLLVTRVTNSRATAADAGHLARLLRPANTTPTVCRQTRLCELVTDLDPKITAAALGMNDAGLVRYAADNVDQDRLQSRVARHL